MALSKIWAAFIIVAITMAGFKFTFYDDKEVFNRMVTGKSSDEYVTVYYAVAGEPDTKIAGSKNAFEKRIQAYGYTPVDSAHAPRSAYSRQ